MPVTASYKESSIAKERNAFIIGGNGLSVGGYMPEGSILPNIGLVLKMQKRMDRRKKKKNTSLIF